MTRPIKFRFFDTESNQMEYIREGDCMEIYFDLNGNMEVFMVFEGSDGGWEHHKREGHIMQFTGLLDKNGVEIYEGDIVSTGKEEWQEELDCNREIFWGEKELMFGFRTENGQHASSLTFWIDNQYKQLEVVGNIYENPELLGRFHYTKLQSHNK